MELEKNSKFHGHSRPIVTGEISDLTVQWLPGVDWDNVYRIYVCDESDETKAYTLVLSQAEAEIIAIRLAELTTKYKLRGIEVVK
jgi:hypothetical protein